MHDISMISMECIAVRFIYSVHEPNAVRSARHHRSNSVLTCGRMLRPSKQNAGLTMSA